MATIQRRISVTWFVGGDTAFEMTFVWSEFCSSVHPDPEPGTRMIDTSAYCRYLIIQSIQSSTVQYSIARAHYK